MLQVQIFFAESELEKVFFDMELEMEGSICRSEICTNREAEKGEENEKETTTVSRVASVVALFSPGRNRENYYGYTL